MDTLPHPALSIGTCRHQSEDAGAQNTPQIPHSDPRLEGIIRAWPDLPEAIRAGIMAMIGAAK